MSTGSYADFIRHWGQIDDRMVANPEEMAPFEPLRLQLESERTALVAMTNQQAALKAATQETSRHIEGHVERGRDLATRLRDAIRAQYGRSDEKLTEFGLNPRRKRKPAPLPPPEDKKSSETGPNPAKTTAPETDGSI
ncbi:MAG TPA: hypothetical protein VNM67_08290 [Thermoanaerobaculia bacterium]|jgi:hypothetical protein|nr:hypothetical protein [Thermoanaerobaculia bacterium]